MTPKPTTPHPLPVSLKNSQVVKNRGSIFYFFPVFRASTAVLLAALLLVLTPCVEAQAPVNDVISWPPGLLLLATVLYAALGAAPDTLWDIEPAIGMFLGTGLPLFSLPTMQRVHWVTRACHFVPKIRTAHGYSNFWIRTEEISKKGRSDVLRAVLGTLQPIVHEQPELYPTPPSPWKVNELGLLEVGTSHPQNPTPNSQSVSADYPSARDFLLFSAVHYHAFWEWEVQIERKDTIIFSTRGTDPRAVFLVDSPTNALPIVAAQLVRRPISQTFIRHIAHQVPGSEPPVFHLNIDNVSHTTPACAIDFHSYAKETAKVSASLEECAGAYFRVVQYIKRSGHGWKASGSGPIAHAHVGQSLWIAILGGAIMDSGRFTIQGLPGRWGVQGLSADESYINRVKAILGIISPHANTPSFGDLVESGGNSRRPAIPFLLAGIFGQVIICYFLSVGTSAGIWTSVALANSLFTGMKMYMPGTKDIIAIATFDRTAPRQGSLRPGLMLNLLGLAAAIFGAIFQRQTRDALGFSTFKVSPPWVVYTSIALTVGVTLLIAITTLSQQAQEKTWFEDSQYPTRCVIYSTLPCSLLIAGLAVFFQITGRARLWPILDAITWVSGMPLGMLENGRMSGGDDNITHIILVNRWLMGAVASAVGSTIGS